MTEAEISSGISSTCSPIFCKKLKSATVSEGESARFTCQIKASPAPDIQWQKDGKFITEGNNIKVSSVGDEYSVEIMNVSMKDAGRYTCIAVNSVGEARNMSSLMVNQTVFKATSSTTKPWQSKVTMTFKEPIALSSLPVYTNHTTNDSGRMPVGKFLFSEIQAEEGESVKLQCQVSADSHSKVSWFHEKNLVKESASCRTRCVDGLYVLELDDVSMCHVGRYVCKAENEFGVARPCCTLSLKARKRSIPNIDNLSKLNGRKSMTTSSSIESKRVSLTILPKDAQPASPPVSHHSAEEECTDNRHVKELVPGSVSGEDSYSLISPPTTVDRHSHLVSPPMTSYNENLDQSNLGKLISQTYSTGVPDKFESCEDNSTTSKTSVDNASNQNCDNLIMKDNSATDLQSADIASNLANDNTFSNIQLLDNNQPKGTRRHSEVTRSLTDTHSAMSASISSSNDVDIKSMEYDDKRVSVFTDMTCSQSEGFDSESLSPATVDNEPRGLPPLVTDSLDEPPFIEDLQPENISVVRGKTVELVATFVGHPLPEACWFKGNKELTPSDKIVLVLEPGRASLTIIDTDSGDTGCYELLLTNEFGCSRLASSVNVEDRPDPPVGKPAVTSITHKSIVLSWSGSSFDGGSPILYYRIECSEGTETCEESWRVVTDNCQHTTHKVRNLKPDTAYRFRVATGNKHGFSNFGEPSEQVITITKISCRSVEGSLDNLTNISESEPEPDDELNSPLMLDGPLSPVSFLAARDEMPFTPRDVKVDSSRKFEDFFILGKEIGRGKFGSVCTCKEKSSGKEFAAKVIRIKSGQADTFRKEIEIMNELRHPKILMLWDAFESQRNIIIVMEHVSGLELLERVINDDYVLTERECIHFMRQICEAVHYMHSCNILHLDLKPENILCVTTNGNEIKIIDFGLARKYDPTKSFKVMFGTPEFVAPEVVNFEEISYTTDMWSTGVIAYVLLSGLSPFLGDSEGETLCNVTAAQYDFDDEAFNEISDDAKDFITKLLLPNSKDRMTGECALQHRWLSQDVTYMRAKRLSIVQHKRFMARLKWQKTKNALVALGRMNTLQQRLMFAGSPNSDSLESTSSLPGSVGKAGSVQSDRANCASIRFDTQDDMRVRTRSLDLKSAFTRFSLNRRSTGVPKTAAVMKSTEQPSLTNPIKVDHIPNKKSPEKFQFPMDQVKPSELRLEDILLKAKDQIINKDSAQVVNEQTNNYKLMQQENSEKSIDEEHKNDMQTLLKKTDGPDLQRSETSKTDDNLNIRSDANDSVKANLDHVSLENNQSNNQDVNLDQTSLVSKVEKDDVFDKSSNDKQSHDDKLGNDLETVVDNKLQVSEESIEDHDEVTKNESTLIQSLDHQGNTIIQNHVNGEIELGQEAAVLPGNEQASICTEIRKIPAEKSPAITADCTSPLRLTRTRIISFRGNYDSDVKSPLTPKTPTTPLTPSMRVTKTPTTLVDHDSNNSLTKTPTTLSSTMIFKTPTTPLTPSMLFKAPTTPTTPSMCTKSSTTPLTPTMFTKSPTTPLTPSMFTKSPTTPLTSTMFSKSPTTPLTPTMFTKSPTTPLTPTMFTKSPITPVTPTILRSTPLMINVTGRSSTRASSYTAKPLSDIETKTSVGLITKTVRPPTGLKQPADLSRFQKPIAKKKKVPTATLR